MNTLKRAVVAIAAVALVLCLDATRSGATTWWHPGHITSFQVQLSGTIDTSYHGQAYEIDWQEAASTVSKLHSLGKRVICYVDVGGWEDYRPDAFKYPDSVKGATVGGWPDERYVDVRARSVLEPILMSRFRTCRNKHFDAIDTDLDDQYQADTGFPLTKASYETFNKWITADVHGLGMARFLKNGATGDSFVRDMQPYADGVVVEECWHYNECGTFQPFATAGKPILNVEYDGSKTKVCPKALDFPMATMEKDESLSRTVRWHCWS